jgi:sulfate adenylyltransferase subunit 2
MNKYLSELEDEAIFVLREAYSRFEKTVILFSGGKDSLVVTYLAKKAFYPAKIPFSLLHVDTGHNFPETITFRDELVKKLEVNLEIADVEAAIRQGKIKEETGKFANRNRLQTPVLLDYIEQNKIDCAIGGARRDEEKARAKERFFSHRDDFGRWDPKNQRPELWNIFNSNKNEGEHFRVFPISNWTEMDVWNFILKENIEVPSLYIAHQRALILRSGTLIPVSPFIQMQNNEEIITKKVRFRTLSDMTVSGAIVSEADSLEKVVFEIASGRTTERENRQDDKRSETSMEDRKKEGYF